MQYEESPNQRRWSNGLKAMKTAVVLLIVSAMAYPVRTEALECGAAALKLDLGNKNPQVLRVVEYRWIKAYADLDTAFLTCLLANRFEVGSMPDKKLELHDKNHVLHWVKSRTEPVHNEMEQLQIKNYDTAAVARGIYSVRRRDGKLTSRFQFIDVFLYRHGRWQAVTRQIAELPLE
jgi:hypothetical protein